MAVDKQTREAVLHAWAGQCFYCGRKATCVDHIVPIKKNGTDAPHNLVACCTSCNEAKGELWLPLDVLAEALTAAQKLSSFVTEAATVYAASRKAAADRVNYGSLPIREGVPGQALMQRAVRHRRPARILATEAAQIAGSFNVLKA